METKRRAAVGCHDVYHEKQIRNMCTLHGLHTFMGKPILTCPQLIEFIKGERDWDKLQHLLFDSEQGLFSPDVVIRYAARHLNVYLWPVAVIQAPGSEERLNNAMDGYLRALVSTSTHTFSIHRLTGDNGPIWCVVDSLANKPQILGQDRDWSTVYGTVRVDVGKQRWEELHKRPTQREVVAVEDFY